MRGAGEKETYEKKKVMVSIRFRRARPGLKNAVWCRGGGRGSWSVRRVEQSWDCCGREAERQREWLVKWRG